jgi:four helix bundle protein
MPFDHEKLDVYVLAIDFVARANEVVEALPRGPGYLADQIQRAALSIVLNIAEGAGKFSGDDEAAFYARARGSATESAAVLDVCAY